MVSTLAECFNDKLPRLLERLAVIAFPSSHRHHWSSELRCAINTCLQEVDTLPSLLLINTGRIHVRYRIHLIGCETGHFKFRLRDGSSSLLNCVRIHIMSVGVRSTPPDLHCWVSEPGDSSDSFIKRVIDPNPIAYSQFHGSFNVSSSSVVRLSPTVSIRSFHLTRVGVKTKRVYY